IAPQDRTPRQQGRICRIEDPDEQEWTRRPEPADQAEAGDAHADANDFERANMRENELVDAGHEPPCDLSTAHLTAIARSRNIRTKFRLYNIEVTLALETKPLSERGSRVPILPLDLSPVEDVKVNRSAVERRAATIPTRRTIKREWQA